MLPFLNDVVDDVEAFDTKIENYIILTSLKGEPTGKLINRIPGSCFFI